MSFNLPNGKAIETLRNAALQGEIQILFSDTVVDGVMTQVVRGVYSPREALELMLKGTGLGIVQANTNGAYAVLADEREEESSGSNGQTSTHQPNLEKEIEPQMSLENTKKKRKIGRLIKGLFAFALVSASNASAQDDSNTGSISGIVSNMGTDATLEGALVKANPGDHQVLTKRGGGYRITGLAAPANTRSR